MVINKQILQESLWNDCKLAYKMQSVEPVPVVFGIFCNFKCKNRAIDLTNHRVLARGAVWTLVKNLWSFNQCGFVEKKKKTLSKLNWVFNGGSEY